MPYEIKHISSNKFQVINRINGKIHSRGTTLEKAEAQIRLMEYMDAKKKYKTGKIDLGKKTLRKRYKDIILYYL